MKVLFINHLLDRQTGGGTAERTFQLSRFMAKAGMPSSVLTLDLGSIEAVRAELQGVELTAVPCVNARFFVPRMSREAMNRLVRQADIVHLSGHWTVLNVMAWDACRKLGKPYVFCPAGALTAFGRSRMLKRLYSLLAGRRIALDARACVAITEQERDEFIAYGIPPDRIDIIPNGIDPAQYELADAKAAASAFRSRFFLAEAPFVLFLGRLNFIKGPDLLLEAFGKVASRFPDLQLVFAGPDDGMEALLRQSAIRLGLLERVRFTGFLGGREKAAALRSARLMVIPSRREAMSIVVLEAGICGTPTLFTRACGLEDIEAAGAGMAVDVSAQALAAGLREQLDHPEATQAAASRLQDLVRSRFLWESQAARYQQLFGRLLAGPA